MRFTYIGVNYIGVNFELLLYYSFLISQHGFFIFLTIFFSRSNLQHYTVPNILENTKGWSRSKDIRE